MIVVSPEDFDVGAAIDAIGGGAGAVASFVGTVRGDADVVAMTLEHYPGFTERAIASVADDAQCRWPLTGMTIVHRTGRLSVGDRIVLVACASRHRAAAIEATSFIIDALKTRAPFWKLEHLDDGSDRWVEARGADEAALARWDQAIER